MSRMLTSLSLSAALMGGAAYADAPKVVADIAPVHALVARVMEGVGTPELIIPAGASPHEYNLRPSEAAALQNAEIVVWMGADLSPWLENAVETLSGDAKHVELLELSETQLLETRESALFEAHVHGDHEEGEGHDDHGHEEGHDHDKHEEGHEGHDHDKHAHEDGHGHDEHEEDHDHDKHGDEDHEEGHEHHGHDHGAHDPHAWLSTKNAAAWMNVIAARLSTADPENAGTYFANAAAGRAELEALRAEVATILEPVRGKNFIVFHDAYQYFENDFDFPAAGAISLGDAAKPSPARIAEIQGRVKGEDISCVLSEPQYKPGLVAAVLDGTSANTAVSDPLGAALEPGAALYPQLIRNLAATLAKCL